MADLREKIETRRTFAIISHPDAGKTTLTEKLLLYGGAIRLAGSVKARKASRHATSDWMEIEKQRGISVTSSVMQFNYEGYCINILDTPGHQDFSEDTYRTLMAADSAVMVIDAAKGVEEQTKKLFHVCSLRGIPIFTFVNKMDRESKDPFELMEDIESVLGIKSYPINWPIGSGKGFKGVYDRNKKIIQAFNGGNHGQTAVESLSGDIDDDVFKDLIGEDLHEKLKEDIELLDIAGDDFDLEKVRVGELTPVFFGSALTNFGVEPFLEEFLNLTQPPLSRESDIGEIDVFSDKFSAFIFKIQANMNPAHRDRIAFMRICSGKFKKGMEVYHYQGGNKVKLAQPQQFLAQDREIVDEAYAGDIIGVFDPGIFRIGDTLCSAQDKFRFEGIPTFAPEYFARVRTIDTMKRKQFIKGITQISQEGAIQVFKELHIGIEEIVVGVVGVLQFEVLEYRMKNEYNVDIKLERVPYKYVRWIEKTEKEAEKLSITSDTKIVKDLKDRDLLLFQSDWAISWALEHNEGLVLSDIGKN
ncbi:MULTISPECIES: peptide chain release factor 3 [Clostridium]|uniref:Peptide chain release factor 3 n=6 Tax=Clostridium TaxID=1485 RepID=A0A2I4N754_CLOBO|nr:MULTISPECIES: peptide chain release factor 3 [Clostridium]EKX78434.1 peptide chain release factor 3 [Clostridium botulinum CFSAN001628]ABS41934.1 peptide chain release factor 3 [Clostridium botulinum F str. Langeland]ACA45766.1 peptide chain release factor 3 [Clostridium botulinum B1 str. Okra]ACO85818.1 peptide chain release factor 3 [Clostridium botulinum A2 str. Kyoto]ADG01036.1 peptide chain release factor 3 [Clostridium botulinum F str. 230613]